ncbi:B-cell receptor-associated protein 31 [Biomphalaria pfeifferi]|uniref:B-cell receptor-associated protein 31 n=1 Tax=Biomphalaria pfeifferi TaxID=112525 RepID=A0AAD8BPU2_BIOPF|nr:B-cell receptor-associated protein 31 [Biomphalaria pfeifferi]
MSSELAAKACRQFQHDKVVCPMKLRHGLFTTAAVDNIDHNPSSTTSKDSFHGTAISLFQHPSEHCKGTERILSPKLEVETISKTLSAAELPDFFTSIPPFLLKMPVEPPQPHNANVSTDNCRFTENGVLGDVLKQAISSELD